MIYAVAGEEDTTATVGLLTKENGDIGLVVKGKEEEEEGRRGRGEKGKFNVLETISFFDLF